MAQKEYANIIYEKKERVATITLNRPKVLNPLNTALMTELHDALQDAENDENIGVIIITGAGDRAFCAGADIPELQSKSAEGRGIIPYPFRNTPDIWKGLESQ